MEDPYGNTTAYTYDGLGRVITKTTSYGTPSAATTDYSYDPDGNLHETVDADGRAIVYTYDALDRETGESWYDANSNLTETITYSYDAYNRLTEADDYKDANNWVELFLRLRRHPRLLGGIERHRHHHHRRGRQHQCGHPDLHL